MIDDPWFYAAGAVAVIMTGISKAGLGAAAGLGVPIMSLVISPVQAAAIMLPILIAMDMVAIYAYRKTWDRTSMAILVPASVVGIALGWLSFRQLNDHWVRILVGLISCGFVAYNALRGRPPAARPNRWKGYACGTVSGFTSFIAHAGGPPVAMYLLPQRLDTARYVGTTVICMAVVNALKIGPYVALGLFDARNLSAAVTLLPLAVVGVLLGLWLRSRITPIWFYRLAWTLLFATGAKLLYDGVRGLLI